MLGGAASMSPQEAQSNLAAWAELLGLDELAGLITPTVDSIVFWIAATSFVVFATRFWWTKKLTLPKITIVSRDETGKVTRTYSFKELLVEVTSDLITSFTKNTTIWIIALAFVVILFSLARYASDQAEEISTSTTWIHPSMSVEGQKKVKAECEMLAIEKGGSPSKIFSDYRKFRVACLEAKGFVLEVKENED